MDEAQARAWVGAADVPRGTIERLERLVALVEHEARIHNLIAPSTMPTIWSRHIVDSLQLLALARPDRWLDIGTGAGFPGLAIAVASDRAMTLAEPRSLRADFLARSAAALGLSERVTIHAGRVESLSAPPFAVVSARAVAPLPRLFAAAAAVADRTTTWLLPKGRGASAELAEARAAWQGEFELVPSITDPAAAIVVARDVRPRTRR